MAQMDRKIYIIQGETKIAQIEKEELEANETSMEMWP